jgi:predicted DCC family thiol-disulfide oxidoreductase YuxK
VSAAAAAAPARWYRSATTRRFGARGSAALRIGFGGVWVLFLLHEYPERDAAWGPDAAWSPALDHAYAAASHWPGWTAAWFTSVADLTKAEFDWYYLATVAIGLAFTVGWRTRAVSLLFMFTVPALENRAPLLTDGGDNVLILMSVYLVFAASGDFWSLDARRRQRRLLRSSANPESGAAAPAAWRVELGAARRQCVTVLHNGAVLLIAAQVCVIYATAGLTKVQGQMWQNGSAMGYVLRLAWFQPWPGLAHWLAGHTVLLTLIGYVTVLVQAGFPFIVFTPKLKYPALVVLVLMHLSIAILLGLPFFSAIMLIGDGIFLSDRVWRAAERWVAGPAYARDMAGDRGTGAGGISGAAGGTADSGTGVRTGGGIDLADGRATLVFDGDCAFCTSSVNWAERRLGAAADFVPWQEIDLAAAGLTQAKAERSVQWLPAPDRPGTIRAGAGAVGRLLLASRWPWRALAAPALIPPFSWVAAVVYRLIAVNRHRLPGGTPACAVPAATRAAMAAAAEAKASAEPESGAESGAGEEDSGTGPNAPAAVNQSEPY